MNSDNKTIQSTIDHEKQLIGCLLLNSDILSELDLVSEDFLDINSSNTYSAIVKLVNQGDLVDLTSVNNIVNTSMFLVECMSLVTAPSGFAYYAKIVKERSTLRKLHSITTNISVKSGNAESSPEELIEYINQSLADIYTIKTKDTLTSQEAVDIVMEGVHRKMLNPTDVTGVTTGVPSVDAILSGIHKTDLVILAARPARGKSAFALQLAKNVSLYGNTPVMFFSLEMGTEQLVQRLVASESKVSISALATGRIDENEKIALEIASKTIGFLPVFFNDKVGLKIKDIRRQIKAHNHRHKDPVGMVIIDYLQLMAIGGTGRDNMVQVVTEISRGLKMIAKEFNVCVLALSQLSRDVEKRGGKPKLSDLRDSGSIEQDADIVMFLSSETNDVDSYGNKQVELSIEKHRSGPTGSCFFNFKGANMTFTETKDISKWED
jgi:replicative DNA helicase